jgi:hypothetical protein
MKEKRTALEAYISTLILVFTIIICLIVIVVNSRYLAKMEDTIDTMWYEIEQVKETNISLYQFIEEHRNDITGR